MSRHLTRLGRVASRSKSEIWPKDIYCMCCSKLLSLKIRNETLFLWPQGLFQYVCSFEVAFGSGFDWWFASVEFRDLGFLLTTAFQASNLKMSSNPKVNGSKSSWIWDGSQPTTAGRAGWKWTAQEEPSYVYIRSDFQRSRPRDVTSC